MGVVKDSPNVPDRFLASRGLVLTEDDGEMRDDGGLADLIVERVAATGIFETIARGTARVSGRDPESTTAFPRPSMSIASDSRWF